MPFTSPYFKKRSRSPCSSSSDPTTTSSQDTSGRQSAYFSRSPLSVHGCVDRLGPLIFAISDGDAPTYRCERSLSCKCCTAALNDARSHFHSCDLFRSRFDSYQPEETDTASAVCWEKANLRIQYSVRHLCPQKCYLRAFAPVRESLLLRKAVHERTDAPLDDIFAGWKCKLDPNLHRYHDSLFMREFEKQMGDNRSKGLPRASVFFVSPEGKRYTNKSDLAKVLLERSRCSTASPCPPQYVSSAKRRLELEVNSLERNHGPIHYSAIKKEADRPVSPPWYISEIETPLGLLEELFCDDPWQLLISAILLNRTSRVQVDAALFEFLRQWPNAAAAAKADPEIMSLVIKPLGLRNRRARGIIRFSTEYLELLNNKSSQQKDETGSIPADVATSSTEATAGHDDSDTRSVAFHLSKEDILGLFYCGEYVHAAYQLFILRDLRTDHPDHALRWYSEYQRTRLLEIIKS